MKAIKADITLKIGRQTHTKSFNGRKGDILTFCRELAKASKKKVLVHFSDEMHPVHVKF